MNEYKMKLAEKLIAAVIGLSTADGAFGSSNYMVSFSPTESNVFCQTTYGWHPGARDEHGLHISIPMESVEAELPYHSLRASAVSEFACQRARMRLIDEGHREIEVVRQTETKTRVETDRRCTFHSGGGHAGGYNVCREVTIERTYLDESLEVELLGMRFTSNQSVRKDF
jgi:hypothetical protein